MARSRPAPPPGRLIWHSDFAVETSVLSQAARHPSLYARLAKQLAKMTARPEYGRAHVPWTCLMELAATPLPGRQDVLRVLLNLHRELENRLSVTSSLETSITREWEEPPASGFLRWEVLEPVVVQCVQSTGAGTWLDDAGNGFRTWKKEHYEWYAEAVEEMRAEYAREPRFRKELLGVLTSATREQMMELCDDIAGRFIREATGREPAEALPVARANYNRYWVTWTYAILVRFAQYAQTIPTAERTKGPFGGYTKLLQNDENDFNDAQLAALAGHCGFIITEDRGLRERINFLQSRGFIRLQAMDFQDIEANWHEPGWRTPGEP